MDCEPELWLLGTDNLFARLGWSPCVVEYLDSFVMGCVIAVVLAIVGSLAIYIPRGIDWILRKMLPDADPGGE